MNTKAVWIEKMTIGDNGMSVSMLFDGRDFFVVYCFKKHDNRTTFIDDYAYWNPI